VHLRQASLLPSPENQPDVQKLVMVRQQQVSLLQAPAALPVSAAALPQAAQRVERPLGSERASVLRAHLAGSARALLGPGPVLRQRGKVPMLGFQWDFAQQPQAEQEEQLFPRPQEREEPQALAEEVGGRPRQASCAPLGQLLPWQPCPKPLFLRQRIPPRRAP
jgi:hypothetical protein